MNIKVKKLHDDAVLPSNAHPSDAGFDLVAIDDGKVFPEGYLEYKTGLSIEPPEGYHTEIFPRSSISKYDLVLANSIGLVDEGYRGEIIVRFKPVPCFLLDFLPDKVIYMRDSFPRIYKKGDKIAQLVFRKTEKCSFVFVEEINNTSRSTGGFGSSGQ